MLVLTVFFAGGGHGTYLPAKLFYPFTMIIAEYRNEIGIFGILLAVFQIPVYALIINRKPKWKYYILGIHLTAVLIALGINGGAF